MKARWRLLYDTQCAIARGERTIALLSSPANAAVLLPQASASNNGYVCLRNTLGGIRPWPSEIFLTRCSSNRQLSTRRGLASLVSGKVGNHGKHHSDMSTSGLLQAHGAWVENSSTCGQGFTVYPLGSVWQNTVQVMLGHSTGRFKVQSLY